MFNLLQFVCETEATVLSYRVNFRCFEKVLCVDSRRIFTSYDRRLDGAATCRDHKLQRETLPSLPKYLLTVSRVYCYEAVPIQIMKSHHRVVSSGVQLVRIQGS